MVRLVAIAAAALLLTGCGERSGPRGRPETTSAPTVAAAPRDDEPFVNSVGMKLLYVPPVRCTLGSPPDEPGRYADEPQRQVVFARGFHLGATEVTRRQWRAVMGGGGDANGDDLPAARVGWADAIAFCRALSRREGRTYRLPTEAEWECACRAGSPGPFAGSGKLDEMGWHIDNSGERPHRVAQKTPNAWGLFDMHGNVAEWCADLYGASVPAGLPGAGAAAAAAAATVVRPSAVRGTRANSKIELGMVGSGGRGNWIGELFGKHGGYQFVACGDYFADRVEAFGKRFAVPESRRYTGLASHARLLAGKCDAVVIESPPYFHPAQAAAAVEAGKHVYLAKPIAVDVPGCLTVGQAGRKATERKLVFLVDFQTRADRLFQEAIKRVHNGDIGRPVNGAACYYCGLMYGTAVPTTPEQRLRKWSLVSALSGDIIVEQNIHAIDVMCWAMDADPLWAVGTGGRKLRQGDGIIWDHFNLVYGFPGDVPVSFTSRQFGQGPDDIGCLVHGQRGTLDAHYFTYVKILGSAPYAGGTTSVFTSGAEANIATFHTCITQGRCDNLTAPASVRSNLACVLGRMAAWSGKRVTWDEMMKANEALRPDLKGLKD